MEFVNIHEAKTHLSKYIERVNKNHEIIVIWKNGVPVGQQWFFPRHWDQQS
ncbi:MAG: Antitoxin Phd YefM, type toxin-antitoxin system [Gammaproteobacteria bacterium]|nr:Antitoxin Phd YefM, type toxin-antitoxin system [Gammaproteobacteria bacterium]